MVVEAGEVQAFTYARSSRLTFDDARPDLVLATSGGLTAAGPVAHPVFFHGFVGEPQQSAAALLAVARVARTRFYTPPGMVAAIVAAADPVVTSHQDRLRFESFSMCGGVYARYDLLPGALDGAIHGRGTTNVDLNPPVRAALARVGAQEPLHFSVGEDVVVRTLDAEVTERKVPLPECWLRGFAEVQLSVASAAPAFEVSAAEARRFVRSLPAAGSRKPVWVVSSGAGLRLTSRPTPGAVALSGPERLKPLEPLLRHARSMRAYAAPYDARGMTGVWELELVDARLVLTLSPESSRGFSGEGGVLADLADDDAGDDADLVSALLSFEPRIDVPHLAAQCALTPERVVRALGRLGAAGRVGYDAAEAAYFHRELPYDPARLAQMHPRLRGARALVESGAVVVEGLVARVTSNGTEHVVRSTATGARCTCPWWGRHQGSRGPCKHVLAVDVVRARG